MKVFIITYLLSVYARKLPFLRLDFFAAGDRDHQNCTNAADYYVMAVQDACYHSVLPPLGPISAIWNLTADGKKVQETVFTGRECEQEPITQHFHLGCNSDSSIIMKVSLEDPSTVNVFTQHYAYGDSCDAANIYEEYSYSTGACTKTQRNQRFIGRILGSRVLQITLFSDELCTMPIGHNHYVFGRCYEDPDIEEGGHLYFTHNSNNVRPLNMTRAINE